MCWVIFSFFQGLASLYLNQLLKVLECVLLVMCATYVSFFANFNLFIVKGHSYINTAFALLA